MSGELVGWIMFCAGMGVLVTVAAAAIVERLSR